MATRQVPHNEIMIVPQLSELLEGYRSEIVASWVQLLFGMEGSHYRERTVTELQTSTIACITALSNLFRTGQYTALSRYADEICNHRAEQGFDISEVLEGHLLLAEAVLPVVQREFGWDRDEEAAIVMARSLDAALRWLVIRFSKIYSLALNARLQDQVTLLEDQRRQLERRVREVTALVRSSMLITSTLNLEQVLTLILEQLAEVVSYDRATIQMVFGTKLRIIAAEGFNEPAKVIGTAFDPAENLLTRRLLNGEAPIVLPDVKQEPAFVADDGDPTRSWIGVPLMVREEVIGALALDKHEPGYYDDEDGQTVLAFASQAAIALQNANLYDRSREQDILQERNRLARDLHDSLSQALFSMVLNAEAANLFFDAQPEKARQQILILHETANAALKEMRTLIFELRPANLEQEGLAAVLTKHAKMVRDRYGIDVRVEVTRQRRLPLPIEKALFRIAQEALNNIIKHARATQAVVALGTYDNMAKMTIEDNGVGLGEFTQRPNTLGMTSMRERAEQLGGTFYVGPAQGGQGTLVKVTVPCDKL